MTSAAALDLTLLRVDQDARVLVVAIDAPPHNYMTATLQEELLALVAAVETDPSVGSVIVTGLPHDRFITHYDVDDLFEAAQRAPENLPAAAARGLVRASGVRGVGAAMDHTRAAGVRNITRSHELLLGIALSPAVWLAGLHGACGGGGVEMAGYFDLRLAAEDTTLQLPELLIGLTTTFGAGRLVDLVGHSAALEMMLEGRPYAADEALRLGLVSEVVPRAELLGALLARAHRYSRRPRATVAAQKRLLLDANHLTAAESLRREGAAQLVGIGGRPTQAALRRWHEMYLAEGNGDSVFVTDPQPWLDGTAVDFAELDN